MGKEVRVIRGIPFSFVFSALLFLWVVFSILIIIFFPHPKGQHMKIVLRGFGSAVVALLIVLFSIGIVAVVFN
jgi:hypothetical protein